MKNHKVFRLVLLPIVAISLLSYCGQVEKSNNNNRQLSDKQIDSIIENMPLREKIGMMFYVKPDHFFAMPLYVKDGVLMVDGKRIVGPERQTVSSKSYLDGPVG